MSFSLLFAIEIVLFNFCILFLYQPNFIFLLSNTYNKNKLSRTLFLLGIICILLLFISSFVLGANYILYRKTLLIH